MKANEVRIGNYITKDGEVFQSTELTPLIMFREDAPTFEGISLTGEWLSKFGFDEHAIGYYNKDFVIFLSYANTGLHQYRLRDFNTIIKYVHQLQNLYFALTGEELTIKENETTNPL